MKGLLKHPFRVMARLLWFGGETVVAAFNFARMCALRPPERASAARGAWAQYSARRFLRIFGLSPVVSGPVPTRGLLVSNHLGYLDILVFSALMPAVFVAKSEVKHWPLMGWFARLAGTVFVHRDKRMGAGQVVDEMQTALDSGIPVVLFPEGTSSDGQTVLPFKSSLLEPAIRQTHPLSAGFIQYELDDGDVGEEVCYWKDMTLFPHLINLLSKRGIRATVRFTPLRDGATDRKILARQLHSEITKLKDATVT
jgi:1-acyl-sn-glycerol-3-phosphate acyltransferase